MQEAWCWWHWSGMHGLAGDMAGDVWLHVHAMVVTGLGMAGLLLLLQYCRLGQWATGPGGSPGPGQQSWARGQAV
jgi:hypothetical protein